jgi:hypothetical protein
MSFETIVARVGEVARRARQHSVLLTIAALIAIPAVFFGGSELLGGHLFLYTDNLLQSYPLRVIVGQDLRHGVFPGWDPYIWSGTPLMAGLNAGAFYPTTLLFAIMPPNPAWVLGEIFIYAAVGIGAFELFRAGGASTHASFLATCCFTFAGAIATQFSVHTDMAEGLVSLPWALLAVRRISEDGRWRWAALFGIALALAVLGGSPEAILAIAISSVAYAVARWTRARESWRALVTRIGAGAVFAIGSTAFLWIPALHFIASSNRQHLSPAQAAENYLYPWTALLGVIPYLEGGYRIFSQLAYFGPSNPTELGFYVGILPLVAVFALMAPSWGRWLPPGERRSWYTVIVVGAVTAVAAGTPLEHVLYHVPFYGNEYDTGRFVVEVDIGACALFAWWLDGGSRPEGASKRHELVSAAVPFCIVTAIAVWFALDPSAFWSTLRAPVPPAARPEGTDLAFVMAGALALTGAVLAFGRRRLGQRRFMAAASVFVVVDIALFAGGSLYISGQDPPSLSQPGAVMSVVATNLTPGGRYAVFDPDTYDPTGLLNAGEADTGAISSIPSVSGYESISGANYAYVTGTKVRSDMSPGFLSSGAYEAVGLQVLVTVPESFIEPMVPGTDALVRESVNAGIDPALPGGDVVLPGLSGFSLVPPREAMSPGTTDTWWFGEDLQVNRAILVLDSRSDRQLVRVGLLHAGGAISWRTTLRLPAGKTLFSIPLGGAAGDGLAVHLVSGTALGPIQPEFVHGSYLYLLGGPLANAVTARQWHEIGTVGDFVLYRARDTPSQTSVEGAGGQARVTETSQDGATISVHAKAGSTLVWSTAYDAGWHASVERAGGPALPVTVEQMGLVMAVEVPPGGSTVVFWYRPPGLVTGLELSVATVGLALIALIAGYWYSRRRRRRPPLPAISLPT